MPMSDYVLWLHGKAAPTIGVDIGHSGSEYSEDEIDTEITYPAWKDWGLHMIVNETFTTTLTSIDLNLINGAATTPTAIVSSRPTILLAALTAGKHFYVPFPKGKAMARYIRGYVVINSGNPTGGQVCMWIGPPDGSENA